MARKPDNPSTSRHSANLNSGDSVKQTHGLFMRLAEYLFLPLCKIFLRHGVLVPELQAMLEKAAIQQALHHPEFAILNPTTAQSSASHAAILTGLSRQRIGVYRDTENSETDDSHLSGLHRLIRILSDWQTLPNYQDDAGHPVILPLRGRAPSLQALVRIHGRDVPVRAVADMLVKSGNAEWVQPTDEQYFDKHLRWRHSVARPEHFTASDIAAMTQIGSDFMHTFQCAFNRNLQQQPRFREAFFADIDASKQQKLLKKLHVKQQKFSDECERLLSRYRADPKTMTVTRLGIGTYSFFDAPDVLGGFKPDRPSTTQEKGNST